MPAQVDADWVLIIGIVCLFIGTNLGVLLMCLMRMTDDREGIDNGQEEQD